MACCPPLRLFTQCSDARVFDHQRDRKSTNKWASSRGCKPFRASNKKTPVSEAWQLVGKGRLLWQALTAFPIIQDSCGPLRRVAAHEIVRYSGGLSDVPTICNFFEISAKH